MSVNTFDDKSTVRIGRAVRGYEKSVLGNANPTRRRVPIASSGSGTANPFQLSLEVIDEIQYAKVSGGIIFNDSQNNIPEGLVDLSEYSIDDTVYIYLKVSTNWFNGVDLRNRPVLTISTETNFYGNNSVFPSTDEDHLFYQIGTVLVKDDGEGENVYSIDSQIANENITIDELVLNGFSLVKFLKGKSTDTEADSNYSLTMNTGNVKLPDNSNIIIPSKSEDVAIASHKYVDLKISATLNSDGFFESFLAVSVFSTDPVSDTNTDVYFSVGRLYNEVLTQNQIGDFVSDGRIW